MLNSAIVQIVDFCVQRRWQVVIFGILLATASATYDVMRFSITTDTDSLISQDLPWHQRQSALSKAFQEKGILVVVTAATPENAEQATNALERELLKHSDLFHSVVQADSGEFFQHNGLLFKPLSDVKKSVDGLSKAQFLIGALANDPSLRGVMKALSFVTGGVQGGEVKLDQLVWPLSMADRTLNDVLSGKPATFSWQELIQGSPPSATQLRHFIEVQPVLDFQSLQPGRKATDAIRHAAADLKLSEKFSANVELTGPVPLNDDQFSVIRQSALRDTLTALIGALIILWLALRSWKVVAAVFFSLTVGLAATAALGIAMVGAFNLISIAFFVLFVGLGVDFGIQFSVRYRSERQGQPTLREALRSAAAKVGDPLALAAAATTLAFFSFLPTSYKGLFELGLIAGCGMLIAFICSITFVPAMLAIVKPPGELASVGFGSLAPLDDFLQRHRIAVIAGTIGVVLAGTPLLFRLPFDFNPINLESPNAPSVVTYRKLQADPETSGNDADVLATSLDEANRVAKRLAALPEVAHTRTLSNFIPDDQDEKIAAIKLAARSLSPALNPAQQQSAPSDQDTIDAIRKTAGDLSKVAGNATGPRADAARHVSGLLKRLAESNPTTRSDAEEATVPSLVYDLDRLRNSLDPHRVTIQTLPPDLVRDWVSSDGLVRVQALPKGNANDNRVLQKFATAVLAAEPLATGPAISLYESGRTVIGAFIEAGVLALAAITVLLLFALRRITDVLLTLIPLLLAGVVALEICALTGTAINFANIIALPLLLGVGVAFKIYYVMAWRDGKTGLLQSALTRAVIFSAMTNAVAFGSMWASSYPGMSSMGKMMALALLCTMAAAVLFQPVLMGPPRQIKADSPSAPALLPTAAE
ncbi:hopanoid biosynthesis associated RND transporter HpnN [Bradyrhizobium sp. LTSPM299]|uniref:hopanoid transporter HpnN n=1 Tax=Bradyrhizobium sp. LTSPM299 TaxID=1619233 RepID=UPI0005C85FAC|nr:MMPL family transporter [Bradyrhizobium sp. LTSPM299]KJC56663.1 hopanoid biosynthesis associated RND transporter HpnN [Bradyrhizobium sp. LTSPM299]